LLEIRIFKNKKSVLICPIRPIRSPIVSPFPKVETNQLTKKKMQNHSFYKLILPFQRNLFRELSNFVDFEAVAKGRKGNLLVRPSQERVPIVRTTTLYNKPAHSFSTIHNQIVESIKNEAPIQGALDFNNALIEIYDRDYTKMKYHSDQALDLEDDSYIALFSCYERPDELSQNALRKLKVQCKTTQEMFEFTLENHSVILFSLATNTQFMHKIVLESSESVKENRWLGITFRKSKTFIHFKADLPYFSDGKLLKLADNQQSKTFYQLRGQENKGIHFIYPEIPYTLSVSDTIMPLFKPFTI
jgi:hypothetical protein